MEQANRSARIIFFYLLAEWVNQSGGMRSYYIYLWAEWANTSVGLLSIYWQSGPINWAKRTSIYGRSGHTKLQDHFIDLVAEWDGLELFYLLMSGAGQ